MSLSNMRTTETKAERNKEKTGGFLESMAEYPEAMSSEDEGNISNGDLSPASIPPSTQKMNLPKFPLDSFVVDARSLIILSKPLNFFLDRTDYSSSRGKSKRRTAAGMTTFNTTPCIPTTLRQYDRRDNDDEVHLGIKNLEESAMGLLPSFPQSIRIDKERTLVPVLENLKAKIESINKVKEESAARSLVALDAAKKIVPSLRDVSYYEKFFNEHKLVESLLPDESDDMNNSNNKNTKLLSVIADVAMAKVQTPASRALYNALKRVNPKALQEPKKNHQKPWQRFVSFLKLCLEVKEPDSSSIIWWVTLVVLIALVDSFYTPFFLSFYYPEYQKDYPVFDYPIFGVYLLNILMNFNIAYYSRGTLIKQRNKIARHYLKGRFCIDFLALILPLPRIAFGNHTFINIEALKVSRLVFLIWDITKLEDYMRLSVIVSGIVRLIKLWVTLLIITNLIACTVHALGTERNNSSWLDIYGFRDEPIMKRYIVAAYWSVTTTFTVGYGDITPHNDEERIFAIFVMMIASVVFGYTMNTINIIIEEINEYKTEKKKHLRRANKYMKSKGISKEMQIRIRKYLEYTLDEEDYKKTLESEFAGMLHGNLRREVFVEVYGKTLRDAPVFQQNNFTRSFLAQVSECLSEIFLSPEQEIFSEGDLEDQSIYFLSRGKIQLYIKKCKTSLKVLNKKNNYFGEISFFTGKPRAASAKSLNFSEVFCLPKDRFMEVINDHHADLEQFHFLKDMMNLYNRYDLIRVNCLYCEEMGHNIRECPSLRFGINKAEVIQNHIKQKEKFRRSFRRREKGSFPMTQVVGDAEQLRRIFGQKFFTENFPEITGEQLQQYFRDPYQTKLLLKEIKRLGTSDDQPLPNLDIITHLKLMKSLSLHDKQALITKNMFYDHYLLTLNFDKVANYELYFPQNNIIKMIPIFEERRIATIMGFKDRLSRNEVLGTKIFKKGLNVIGVTRNIPLIRNDKIRMTKFLRRDVSEPQHQHQHRASVMLQPNGFDSFGKDSNDSPLNRGLSKRMNLADLNDERSNSSFLKPTNNEVSIQPSNFWKDRRARRSSGFIEMQDLSLVEDDAASSKSWNPNQTRHQKKNTKLTKLQNKMFEKDNKWNNGVEEDNIDDGIQEGKHDIMTDYKLSPDDRLTVPRGAKSARDEGNASRQLSSIPRPSKMDFSKYVQQKGSRMDDISSHQSEIPMEYKRRMSRSDKDLPEDVKFYLTSFVSIYGADKVMQTLDDINRNNDSFSMTNNNF